MGEKITKSGSIDLGEIALALVFRSFGYALFGIIAASVAFQLLRIAGFESFTNSDYWRLSLLFWVILQLEILFRLRRVSRTSPEVHSSNHTIHGLELCTAGFLLLFSLARPYLIESDASSYPYVVRLFQLLIGVTAFFHLLVLGIFRSRPTKWDVWILGGVVVVAFIPFLI